MNMIEDFCTVGAGCISDFESIVREGIKDGYQPYGEVFQYKLDGEYVFMIAMVKYKQAILSTYTSPTISYSYFPPINASNTVIQNMIDDLSSFKKKYDDYQYFRPCTANSDIPAISLNFQEEVKFVLNKASESIVYLIDRLLELNIPLGEPNID